MGDLYILYLGFDLVCPLQTEEEPNMQIYRVVFNGLNIKFLRIFIFPLII